MAERRIVSTPDVVSGQARVDGTRIMVSVVLDALAEGLSPSQVVDRYPGLEPADVQACPAHGDPIRVRHPD